MVNTLKIGLTNVLDESFTKDTLREDALYSDNVVNVNAYTLSLSKIVSPVTTIEWVLNEESSVVTKLLKTIKDMSSRIIIKNASTSKHLPVVDDYNSFSFMFDFVNIVPNPTVNVETMTDTDFSEIVTYAKFGDLALDETAAYAEGGNDETTALSYAIANETTEYLAVAYPDRKIIPSFTARFFLNEKDYVPQTALSKLEIDWLKAHESELNAKGWDISSPRIKMGYNIIGSLVGDPWEQYQKIVANNYICSIDIVES